MDLTSHLTYISQASDPRLAAYTSLTDHELRNKLDPEKGLCIVESEIAVRVALECGLDVQSMLVSEHRLEHMIPLIGELVEASAGEAPIYVLPLEESEKLTGYTLTRGVLCIAKRPKPASLDELLQSDGPIAILQGLTDAANVGAIFRSASALGAAGVVVASDCADPLTRRAIRVSMGNVFRIPWTRCTSLADMADELHARGVHLAALALTEDAVSLADADFDEAKHVAILLGSEGEGLSADALAVADSKLVIPMARNTDSLNVGAAAAIALWELTRS